MSIAPHGPGTDRSEILKKEYQQMLVVAASMMGSILIYWFVVQFLVYRPAGEQAYVRYLFYFIAMTGLPVSLILKKAWLQKKPDDSPKVLIFQLKRTTMMTMSLSEMPALLGVVLYFLSGLRQDFYVLALYSFLLLVVFFPRWNQWQEYTQNAL